MDTAGPPFTQCAPAIVDRRLRDRSKRKATDRWHRQQSRQQRWHDVQSQRARGDGGARNAGKCLIGRRHQPSCKGDSLRLVCVENWSARAFAQNRGELPGEIHRISDTGVHTLPADRTMDVCRIAQEERASAAEAVGDPMMHVIRREPVHAFDVDTHPLDHARADIIPGQALAPGCLRLLSNGPDEARAMCVRQREHGEEVSAVERDVDVAVHRRSVRLDIGDVEEVLVRPARKTDRQHLAETRVSAVAAGDERGFAEVDATACTLKPRDDALVAFLESDEFRLPLDLYSGVAQPIDQQPLVLVLRKDERIGVRADARCPSVRTPRAQPGGPRPTDWQLTLHAHAR